MNVNIQAHRFSADAKLKEIIEKRITKLNMINERITKVDVFLMLDNIVHKIKDKVVSIQVRTPGHDFFVKHSSKSFEESYDAALNSLITQMVRKKEKLRA